jgi:hypothetical protein
MENRQLLFFLELIIMYLMEFGLSSFTKLIGVSAGCKWGRFSSYE